MRKMADNFLKANHMESLDIFYTDVLPGYLCTITEDERFPLSVKRVHDKHYDYVEDNMWLRLIVFYGKVKKL